MSDRTNTIAGVWLAHRPVGRLGCACGRYSTAPIMDDTALLAEHAAHVAAAVDAALTAQEGERGEADWPDNPVDDDGGRVLLGIDYPRRPILAAAPVVGGATESPSPVEEPRKHLPVDCWCGYSWDGPFG